MKKILFAAAILFAANSTIAQVGVQTDAPTRGLDVNGDLRVRTLTNVEGNSEEDDYDRVLVANNGTTTASNEGNVDYISIDKLFKRDSKVVEGPLAYPNNSALRGRSVVTSGCLSARLNPSSNPTINSQINLEINYNCSDATVISARSHAMDNGGGTVTDDAYRNESYTQNTWELVYDYLDYNSEGNLTTTVYLPHVGKIYKVYVSGYNSTVSNSYNAVFTIAIERVF